MSHFYPVYTVNEWQYKNIHLYIKIKLSTNEYSILYSTLVKDQSNLNKNCFCILYVGIYVFENKYHIDKNKLYLYFVMFRAAQGGLLLS